MNTLNANVLANGSVTGTKIADKSIGLNHLVDGLVIPGSGGGGGGGTPAASNIDWINVKAYGAVGNGVADDTEAINAAINALPAAGGTVYVPDGVYMIRVANPYSGSLIDGSIRIRSNMTFKMSNQATLRAITNGMNNYTILHVIGKTNVNIDGGILQGERYTHTGPEPGQAGMGIWISGSTNVRIVGVTCKEFWGDGIYNGYTPANADSKNIFVSGCYLLENRRQGISITAVNQMTVTGCIFENTQGTDPAAGIDIEPELGGVVSQVAITGNVFKGNKIGIAGVVTTGYTSIVGNTFDGNTTYGVHLGTGKYYNVVGNTFRNNSLNAIFMNFAEDSVVADNLIDGSGSHGIWVLNQNYRNTISGNRISKSGGYGILIENSHYNSVTGNHVTESFNSGISTEASNNTNITGNYCFNNTQMGIYIFTGRFAAVSGNHCTQNKSTGIRVTNSADFTVTNNFCAENSQVTTNTHDNIAVMGTSSNGRVTGNTVRMGTLANVPRYGVRIDAPSVTGTIAHTNDVRSGGQTGGFSDVGTGTITTVS